MVHVQNWVRGCRTKASLREEKQHPGIEGKHKNDLGNRGRRPVNERIAVLSQSAPAEEYEDRRKCPPIPVQCISAEMYRMAYEFQGLISPYLIHTVYQSP